MEWKPQVMKMKKKVPPTESCERCNASFFRGGTFISASCPYLLYIREKQGRKGGEYDQDEGNEGVFHDGVCGRAKLPIKEQGG